MPKYVCKHATVCMQRCAQASRHQRCAQSKPMPCINYVTPRMYANMRKHGLWACMSKHAPWPSPNMRPRLYAEMFGSTQTCLAAPKHPLSASMYGNIRSAHANIRSAHHALPSLNACMYEDRIGSPRIWHGRIPPYPHCLLRHTLTAS